MEEVDKKVIPSKKSQVDRFRNAIGRLGIKLHAKLPKGVKFPKGKTPKYVVHDGVLYLKGAYLAGTNVNEAYKDQVEIKYPQRFKAIRLSLVLSYDIFGRCGFASDPSLDDVILKAYKENEWDYGLSVRTIRPLIPREEDKQYQPIEAGENLFNYVDRVCGIEE